MVLLAGGGARAYEEEPSLPEGEWMLLEGRTEEALRWYRARYAEAPGLESREGLAEALTARASELLGRHRPVEARLLLEEASALTREAERADRIQHLIAYAEKRTTGHAVLRGNRALALGDLEAAHDAYEEAVRDARDDFERSQGHTLLSLLGLLRAVVDDGSATEVQRAVDLWPEKGESTEDVQAFLQAARVDGSLMGHLRDAAERLEVEVGDAPTVLRGVTLCLLLRTKESRKVLAQVGRPRWRAPLEALLAHAERLVRNQGGRR
jgi:tetratricopeptide (TPR) repeat protein